MDVFKVPVVFGVEFVDGTHAFPQPFLGDQSVPIPTDAAGAEQRSWRINKAEDVGRNLRGQIPEEVALQQRRNGCRDKEQLVRCAVAEYCREKLAAMERWEQRELVH